MSQKRGNGSGETLIFTCAGAAHGGQVANRAGVHLGQSGAGKLFCMAAVAAEIPDKVDGAKGAARRVVIDGCGDQCCGKILQKAGLPVELHVLVTELGVEKRPADPSLIRDTKKVVDHIVMRLKGGHV